MLIPAKAINKQRNILQISFGSVFGFNKCIGMKKIVEIISKKELIKFKITLIQNTQNCLILMSHLTKLNLKIGGFEFITKNKEFRANIEKIFGQKF